MGFDGPGLKIGRTNKAAGFGQISSLLDNGRMWAVRKLNRRDYQYRYQKPQQTRSLSPIYLPTELWLLLPPILKQADIRALAGVCIGLRMIFRPVMKLKVTIIGNDSPTYALQKALVITRTPALLDSVVEIYMGENTMSHLDARGQIIYKTHYLLLPAITILLKAIPAMQQLHTVRLARMSVSRMELYSILSSPRLIHLILDRVRIPKLNRFPPPTLRKLTLIVVASWEGVEPLIGQLATSLEYLELQQCDFLAPRPLQYPAFPRLRELRHHQWYLFTTFSDRGRLSELFHLGSQITHLHLSGSFEHIRVAAFPASLWHLSVEAWMLTEQYFKTCTLHGLLSLSVKQCVLGNGSSIRDDHIKRLPSLIRDCFPRISSLQLHIQWSFRNVALVIARFQRNVQALNLVIETLQGLDYEEEIEAMVLDRHNKITTAYLSTEQAPLQSLRLDVTQTYYELEQSVAPCTRWVESDTILSVIGLGGPDLKHVDVSFIQLETNWVQERVLRRQWAKSIKGEWEVYKCL